MALNSPFVTADSITREILSSGVAELDRVLHGGLELGLAHLLYGDSCLQDDLLKLAAQAVPNGPVIIIDSANMIDTSRLTDLAGYVGIEPEDAFRSIHVSRAFNSSQTYDLVVNHLEGFLLKTEARVLILPGLVDIFLREGMNAPKAQQVAHVAAVVMQLSLNRDLVCLVSAEGTTPSGLPRVGQSMLSCAQVHIRVELTPIRIIYTLTKHPHLSTRSSERNRDLPKYYVTIPLDEFMDNSDHDALLQ